MKKTIDKFAIYYDENNETVTVASRCRNCFYCFNINFFIEIFNQRQKRITIFFSCQCCNKFSIDKFAIYYDENNETVTVASQIYLVRTDKPEEAVVAFDHHQTDDIHRPVAS
mgnify:CR=1 FL=1